MTAPTTPTTTTSTLVQKVKALLVEVDAAVQNYYAHLSTQAINWLNISQHDLTKWEAAASTLGVATATGLLKKIQAWLAKP